MPSRSGRANTDPIMLDAHSRARRLAASISLAALSTLVGLAVLEVALRARAHFAGPAGLGAAPPGQVPPGGRARLGHVVRLSPDPRIVYELVPGLDVTFLGVPLRTNADGFRGPVVPPSRMRPAVRVVGLGDSVMFGWGVSEEDAYLARLAPLLEAASPGVAWEVVNTAVPGYNTVMEVATLETKGLRYDPDLVILNFVGNDLGLPNFIEERPDVLSLRQSFLLGFVRSRLGGEPEQGRRLVGVPPEVRRFGGEADLARVPSRYRSLVGPQAFRAAVERLRDLAGTHGFEVVVLAHPEVLGYAGDAAREMGFALVETGAAVRAWAHEHGLSHIQQPPLTLTPGDPHPSTIGHAIIAAVLADHLRSSGLAERLVARRRSFSAAATTSPAP
jgi:lysophospholipase L1-like esterase